MKNNLRSKIRFGDDSPETMNALVVVKKAEDIKRYGYGSRYNQQTAYLRDTLGERVPCFNGAWRQSW